MRGGLGFRDRVRLVLAAVSRAPVVRMADFNPAYVSNTSAWRSIFSRNSVNAWGSHGDPFECHPIVYRCIQIIHNDAAGVPLLLSRKQGAEVVPLTEGIEWTVLDQPNAAMSQSELIGATAGLMQCDEGEAFWYIAKAGDARAIVMLNPEMVDVVRKSGVITYRYMAEGGPRELTEAEVIHFKTFNPRNPLRGLGPMKAAHMTFTDDFDLRTHNRQIVRNGGIYRPILTTEQSLPEAGSAEDQALEAQLDKFFGTPDNRGKTIVLPLGLKLNDTAKDPADMDFANARKGNFKEICGIFGVAPQMAGDFERDQADAQAQELSYWSHTQVPLLRYIARKIQTDMWKISGIARARPMGILVGFDFDTVPALVMQKQQLYARDAEDVGAGIVLVNEVRRRRGLPDVEHGNKPPWTAGFGEQPGIQDPASDPAQNDNAPDNSGKGNVIPITRPLDAGSTRDALILAGFTIETIPIERMAAAALRGVMNSIEREVLAKVGHSFRSLEVRKPVNVTEFLFDIDEATRDTARAMQPSLKNAQLMGGKRGLRLAKSPKQFQIDAKPAIAYLAKQTQRFSKPVATETWDKLKKSLTEGLAAGEGERELTARVKDVMNVRRSEAARTARTEINAAANGGVDLGFKQSGVVVSKRWVIADNKARPAHKAANGQIVPIDGKFTVGGEQLAFPGDPEGSAENVIECRCTIDPVLKAA